MIFKKGDKVKRAGTRCKKVETKEEKKIRYYIKAHYPYKKDIQDICIPNLLFVEAENESILSCNDRWFDILLDPETNRLYVEVSG